jgi:hypothetical protein
VLDGIWRRQSAAKRRWRKPRRRQHQRLKISKKEKPKKRAISLNAKHARYSQHQLGGISRNVKINRSESYLAWREGACSLAKKPQPRKYYEEWWRKMKK